MNVGIPQCSCFGPLLFLEYINDIFSSTEINMRLFADDACLSYQHSDLLVWTVLFMKSWEKFMYGCVLINFLYRKYYFNTKFFLFNILTSKESDLKVNVNGFNIDEVKV